MKPETVAVLVLAAAAVAGVAYLVTRPAPAAPPPQESTTRIVREQKGPLNQIISGVGDVIGGVVDVFV